MGQLAILEDYRSNTINPSVFYYEGWGYILKEGGLIMSILEKRTRAVGFCSSKGVCDECPVELSEGICREYNFITAPVEVIDRVLEIANMEEKANE
jgi:hypothetical protein